MKTILITGGSGLIGRPLAKLLKNKGYRLILLSRGSSLPENYDAVFTWDAEKKSFDPQALDGVTGIIHLAGAGIADKRWTDKRKKEIVESRTEPLKALHEALRKRGQRIECLVSGSAVGWYGAQLNSVLCTEDLPSAEDFMGETCRLWENAAYSFGDCCSRIVSIRTGIVLDSYGGVLPPLLSAVRLGLGAPLGSGKQQMPWIHRNDMVAVFANAIENEGYIGSINATATEDCTNYEFTKVLSRIMKRPFWPIGVPAFFLKLILGEMSAIVLGGSRISNAKLRKLGFRFEFSNLHDALAALLKTQTPAKQS